MEPLLTDPRLDFVLAMWPLYVGLAVVWIVARWCDDEDTEPSDPQPNTQWMTDEERRYHGDDSFGR